MSNMPIERKVYAGTLGAGAGTAISGIIIYTMDSIWWPSPTEEVPTPVAAFISLVVITGLSFLSGWLAKHTPRTDLNAAPFVP